MSFTRDTVEVVREDAIAWHTRCIAADCPNIVSTPKSFADAAPPRVCAGHPVAAVPAMFADFKSKAGA